MLKRTGSVILSILLTLSIAAAGTGCAKTPVKTDSFPTSSTQTGTAKAPVSITVWTNFQAEVPTLQEYAKQWSEATGNTATVVHQDAGIQAFTQAANSSKGPDIVYGTPNDTMATFVSASLVQEVPQNTITESEYAKAAVQACKVNGKTYGVPIAVETTALFYNTDKIKTIPQTWDELIETAKTSGGIMFDLTQIYYDLGFLRAEGGYIFKNNSDVYDTKDIGLGNDGAIKAYTFLNSLVNQYKFISSDITQDIARSNFQNGKTAFYIGGPWDISGLKTAGTKFAVAPMPKFDGQNFVTPVGTQVAFVSKKSQKQDTAWDFIKYMLDKSALKLYDVGARIPAKLEYQQNATVSGDPNTKAFVEQISVGEPMPTTAELGQVWTPYQNNLKLLLTKNITEKQAASNIVTQIQSGIATMNSGK